MLVHCNRYFLFTKTRTVPRGTWARYTVYMSSRKLNTMWNDFRVAKISFHFKQQIFNFMRNNIHGSFELIQYVVRSMSTQMGRPSERGVVGQPKYHELCWRIEIHIFFLQKPGPLRGEREFARPLIRAVRNSIQCEILFARPNLVFTSTNKYLFLCASIFMTDLGWPSTQCVVGQPKWVDVIRGA